MEKIKIILPPGKRASFYNKNNSCVNSCDSNTEIRLGINSADEKAQKELRKRKIEAPLTIEEKILTRK